MHYNRCLFVVGTTNPNARRLLKGIKKLECIIDCSVDRKSELNVLS